MLPRPDELTPRRPPGDRRLWAVRLFVLLTGVVLVGALVVFFALRRHPATASSAAPQPLVPQGPEAPGTPAEAEPRLNQYLFADRFVVEAIVPGANPEVRISYDAATRRNVLTFSWTPPTRPAEDPAHSVWCEWELKGFRRTVVLPPDVSTPARASRDGILTLTFPRGPGRSQLILPGKDN
jgi:HSP20 family molecular chaperone IbpA